MPGPGRRAGPWLVLALVAFALNTSFLWSPLWHRPAEQHHIDESFLPLEALGLWEGVTPRELGWPASTTRILLSISYAARCFIDLPVGELAGRGVGPMFDALGGWIAGRYDDPSDLYLIGRWLSAITGTIYVLLCFWAARRWGYNAGAWISAFAAAMCPLVIEYSQVVLADITGLVFVAACVGLMAPLENDRITHGRAALGGALVGLAAASKFHFGVWLVAVLLWIWLASPRQAWANSLTRSACAVLACGIVVVTLVPWIWTNPLVIVKELLGTVVDKTGNVSIGQRFSNIATALRALGPFVAVPGLLGLGALIRSRGWRGSPIVMGLVGAFLAIASLQTMFDRYALLLLPGFVVTGAAAIDRVMSGRVGMRIASFALLATAGAFSVWLLIDSQRLVGGIPTYTQARDLIVAHVSPRARIAVDALFWARLPRTASALMQVSSAPYAPDAYKRKMAGNGILTTSAFEPMHDAVLTDELFHAHWARLEHALWTRDGYEVVVFADDPRFQTILTKDALRQFIEGLDDSTKGFDVLVLRGNVPLPIEPRWTIPAGSGPRLRIFTRPASAYITP